MYIYERTIRLADTDATGVLYFANQPSFATEAFEQLLLDHEYKLKGLSLPVVHMTCQYSSPLSHGDNILIELSVKKIGTSSFTLRSEIKKDGFIVGEVEITHVAVAKKSSIPLPEPLLEILSNNSFS